MPHARKRARSRRLRVKPDRLEAAVEEFRRDQLPKFKQQPGFQGFTLLANRESGKLFGVSYWENEDDVAAAAELGRDATDQVKGTGQGEAEDPDEWVVVIDEEV